MFFTKEIKNLIEEEKQERSKICQMLEEIKIKQSSKNTDYDLLKNIPQIVSRIEDLELWRSKIHSLLTTTSAMSNEDKLSKIGRKFAISFNQKK